MTETITYDSVEQKKTIVIVTTDKLGQTGRCTWSYMFAKNSDGTPVIPNDVQNAVCGLPWGFLWTPIEELRNPSEERSRPFNIFGEKGLEVGGGFEPFKDRSSSPFVNDYDVDAERERHRLWQIKMLDNIPACSILMSTEDFEWLEKHILESQDRHYVRFHCDISLFTS